MQVGHLADDLRRRAVDFADEMLGGEVGLADRIGIEGVGREHVRTGVGEAPADRLHQLRPGQVQQVVVAALVLHQVEPGAIIGAPEPLGLDHRAIGAVLDENAPRRFRAEGVGRGHWPALTPSRWQMA